MTEPNLTSVRRRGRRPSLWDQSWGVTWGMTVGAFWLAFVPSWTNATILVLASATGNVVAWLWQRRRWVRAS